MIPREVFKRLTSAQRYGTIGTSKQFDKDVLGVSMEMYPSEHWHHSDSPAIMVHIFGDYHLSRRHPWLCMHGFGAFENTCMAGNIDVVRMIYKYAAADDIQAGFDMACSRGDMEIINMLSADKRVNVHGGLWLACERGHKDVAERILSLKPGYKLSDESRDASIIKTCICGNVDLLRFLLASTSRVPANVYAIGLSEACERGHTVMAEYLIGLRLIGHSDLRKALASAGKSGDIVLIKHMMRLMKLDRLPAIGGALERGYFHVYIHFARAETISQREHEILLCGACIVGAADSVRFLIRVTAMYGVTLDINGGLSLAYDVPGKSKRTTTVKYLKSIGAVLPGERKLDKNKALVGGGVVPKTVMPVVCECDLCWHGDAQD